METAQKNTQLSLCVLSRQLCDQFPLWMNDDFNNQCVFRQGRKSENTYSARVLKKDFKLFLCKKGEEGRMEGEGGDK